MGWKRMGWKWDELGEVWVGRGMSWKMDGRDGLGDEGWFGKGWVGRGMVWKRDGVGKG